MVYRYIFSLTTLHQFVKIGINRPRDEAAAPRKEMTSCFVIYKLRSSFGRWSA
jgi:hypothetical protein